MALGLRLVEPGECRAQCHDIVGQQSSSRIAHLGLNLHGFARNVGLGAERLELAAHLAGEVGEASEVGLHGLELAHGLFFATPLLENSGGLFNKPATIFGARLQNALESSLPHDHVHLAAKSGVAQQLLQVEETTRLPVDGVLTRSVAKQRATNGDFGVVDGQRTIGVVDGERHLGATQRSARGGTGKDDVFHLSAAKGLGALFTHHPGEGINDVRFSRTVGTHDAGHPFFEGKRGGLRK